VVGQVVKDTIKTFKKSGYNFEVVVVNDKSKDDSGELAEKAGATVINHILNQGAGGAISTGLAYARENSYDYAVTMDADGQHDPADALACLKQAVKKRSDLLIGSRMMNTKGMKSSLVIGNKGLSIISNILFGVNVSDSQSGLRVFSSKAINDLHWTSTRYEFCSEMLLRAKQARLTIKEYPIKAIYTDYSNTRGQNQHSKVANGIHIVKRLVGWRLKEMLE
jgi:glycosyltransferase involved in cell wall biosynthesis